MSVSYSFPYSVDQSIIKIFLDYVYQRLQDRVQSDCAGFLVDVKQHLVDSHRCVDSKQQELERRSQALRLREQSVAERQAKLTLAVEQHRERLGKLNVYRDTLMRSIQVQLGELEGRRQNVLDVALNVGAGEHSTDRYNTVSAINSKPRFIV